MLELLTNQAESDEAFDHWCNAMISGSVFNGFGWVIESSGLAFSNYGHGEPKVVSNEVMLGADADFKNGVIKIVRPRTSQRDKGKLTAIARDEQGRNFLLRQGWMKKNNLSREVRDKFSTLTNLKREDVSVSGKVSDKHWYVVADLSASQPTIVASTTTFALACLRARLSAGGGVATKAKQSEAGYGVDEEGRVIVVTTPGQTKEIVKLQGFVWKELKKLAGDKLRKPKRDGFCVDGVIQSANLLIEIKTGVAANEIYVAVGQLTLYPELIGLSVQLQPALLIPDLPVLPQTLAAALDAAKIPVYTFNVGGVGKKPKITFSGEFLTRCGI